ncbi:MAG: alpha-ketoglutarate-dependent dioxygenase AlkB [Ancalomicrobiaceae bacterium]|nr:alpha-ketoglutarate-dependent dioxygenase AlkB [Ancalomicrobiaceae bacterium]
MTTKIGEHRGVTIQPGATLFPARLDRAEQEQLLADLRAAIAEAPLFRPEMPKTGKPFSVRMTNLGPLGWVSDRLGGYRYQPTHPTTGQPWPKMPRLLLDLWAEVCAYPGPPEACLVNFYEPSAKMGLHQDRDEADFAAPILSVSLGDSCRFRLGGADRSDPTRSFELNSGDVVVLAGPSRLAFHGVDRILAGTSRLLPEGGRVNLTLRRVTGMG